MGRIRGSLESAGGAGRQRAGRRRPALLLLAALQGLGPADARGGPTEPSAPAAAATPATPSAPAAAPARSSAIPPAAPAASIVADARWCGIEPVAAVTEPAPSCKLPNLPCGPASPEQIHRGSGELGEDLDGDGRAELLVGGRQNASRPELFSAIYRATEAGFVLSDYRVLPPHTEPTFASVVFAQPGTAPLVRDGYDVVEPGGRSLSVARLRRYDGQRFRTLLTFCAHRIEPGAAGSGSGAVTREGHNRADLLDVDKDGSKEVVVQGLLRPVVFRFTEGGLGLVEDPALTQRYRDGSPEAQRSRALRAEAGKLTEGGQTRRAAETLVRAFLLAPHDVELGLELVAAQLAAGQPERAQDTVQRLSFLMPERVAVRCAAAGVHRALGDAAAELAALRSCAADEPDETLRGIAAARLRELQPPPAAPPVPAPVQPPPVQPGS